MKTVLKSIAGAALVALAGAAAAQQGETVKIAWIDPLSGLMAPVGTNQLRSFKFFAEQFNKNNPAGVKFEVVGFDNKLSPAESLTALKAAIDQGARYIAQGNGSAVAGALIDAIARHNQRNPGKEVVYLNHAAVDPDFTNSKCNYWHFRFDADTSMKVKAIAAFLEKRPEVKKVFLLNQNYSHGHQVAKYAKEYIAQKRPDIQIVGEDLHPLAQVRDFAPYVAKIKASGADAVVTGNWGSDLSLLVKAAVDGGYDGQFLTYYAGVVGTPAALGKNGEGKVYQIGYSYSNMPGDYRQAQDAFQARFPDDFFFTGSVLHIYNALGAAMAKAKSTDPVKVAAALEGLKFKSFAGEVEMRRDDHQLQQPLYASVWEKAGQGDLNVEKTGMTFKVVQEFPIAESSTPTTCKMKRPS
ncbi:MAG: branched-chain amino acid ABC transporter substrate-binding protein [Pseudomonadota bacterium]|nr:branched-chain amino acid ABC transporter substrate-binding protein [Pseudomonadota bacterium]